MRRSPSPRGLVALALAAALSAAAASADAASTPVWRRSAVGVELSWWSTEQTGSVFPIVPFFHYEVSPDLFVDVDFGIAPQTGGRSLVIGSPDERFGTGNPMLGAHFARTVGGTVTWFAGVRAGFPLATFGELPADRANDLASAAYAHYDFYRWVPELVPIVVTAGFEAHPNKALWVRLPVSPILLVPTTDRRVFKGGFQARFEIEGQASYGLGGGAALQLVASDGFRTRDEDRLQTALEPYLVFDNDTVLLRFGLLVALDRPLGFGVEEGGVLTPRITLGGHLP